MRARRVVRIVLVTLVAMLFVAGLVFASVWLYLHPRYEQVVSVVYGQRRGRNSRLVPGLGGRAVAVSMSRARDQAGLSSRTAQEP